MLDENFGEFCQGVGDSGGMAEFALLYDVDGPSNLKDNAGYFKLTEPPAEES